MSNGFLMVALAVLILLFKLVVAASVGTGATATIVDAASTVADAN